MTANAHRRIARFVLVVFMSGPCLDGEAGPTGVRALDFRDGSPEELRPVASPPAGRTAQPIADLPLILAKPTVATVGDKTFVLDREGLYRFFDLDSKTTTSVMLDRGDL